MDNASATFPPLSVSLLSVIRAAQTAFGVIGAELTRELSKVNPDPVVEEILESRHEECKRVIRDLQARYMAAVDAERA